MKRIIGFLIAVFVFIFNCCPVFALDSFSSDHFLSVAKDYMTNDILNFINDDLTNKKYHFFILDRDFSRYMFILKSNTVLDYEFLSGDNSTITITNNSTEDDYLYSLPDFLYSFVVPAGESITWHPGGYNPYFLENDLLIVDGNCVSKIYCSPDIYVDLETEGDYEEDGVVIKGLTSFFNNMINSLKNVVDSILELPEKILNILKDLFIPNIENMKTSFNNFIDYMTSKFGFTPLIETLHSLVDSVSDDGSSVGAADVKDNFNYTFEKDFSMNFDFSIPFSQFYNSIIKGQVGDYMKGVFFLLLIFYNLSELYFIIRGVRPWKDPAIVTELNAMQAEKAERHRRR